MIDMSYGVLQHKELCSGLQEFSQRFEKPNWKNVAPFCSPTSFLQRLLCLLIRGHTPLARRHGVSFNFFVDEFDSDTGLVQRPERAVAVFRHSRHDL